MRSAEAAGASWKIWPASWAGHPRRAAGWARFSPRRSAADPAPAVRGQPTLAAQIYAASLLAIEVDTPAEKKYLDQLEAGLGLQPEVTQRIKDMVGLRA
jgi:hypothetical protein